MAEKRASDEIRQRALGAMLTDAFFTWPSAVTIALTIIAFFSGIKLFEGWQAWYWLIAGTVLEVIYLIATITDPTAQREAVTRMLTEKYDPGDIKNLHARQQLQKALEYKRNIDSFVAAQQGAMRVALEDTSGEIEEWIALIHRLGRSIDQFEANTIIRRDRQTARTELSSLERRIEIENDPSVKAELQRAIDIRRDLLTDLQKVESIVKRTEIKMETTVAQLSTIYTKLQLIDAKELDSSRAKRLQEEIHDEVASLNDIVEAIDDVRSFDGYSDAVANLSARPSDESSADADQLRRTTSTRK
jgi:uncharacterized protein YoxC